MQPDDKVPDDDLIKKVAKVVPILNGKDNDIAYPREDNISISTEDTLDYATSDKVKVLQFLNELVDEVYERVKAKDMYLELLELN